MVTISISVLTITKQYERKLQDENSLQYLTICFMPITMENGYSKLYMLKDMLLSLNLHLSKIILKKVTGIYGSTENIKYLIMVY